MSLPQNKRFAARRLLCLLLALAFGLALAGCGSSASSEPAAQDQEQVLTDDALYELTAEKVNQPLDGAGAAIALAVGAEGTDIGAGAAVWQTLENGLNMIGAQVGIQRLVIGIIVVFSVLLDVVVRSGNFGKKASK